MGLQSFAIKLAGALTVSVTGVPLAGDLMESLLGDLAAAQDEQANQLRELERKIDRLLDGPLHTANMYIREAAVPGSPRRWWWTSSGLQLRSYAVRRPSRKVAQWGARVC